MSAWKVRKISVWTRFPGWVREARIRRMHGAGMREDLYPLELRRLLMLAYRKR